MTETAVIVHPDSATLAAAVAARLAIFVQDAQVARGAASVVLTGGTIANKAYAALRDAPVRDAVDWSRVDLWWGDERFLPDGDPDRNATQAHAALLDAIGVTPSRVHEMPHADSLDGDAADAAAERYAGELSAAGGGVPPHFDLVLLGIGPDGHVASLFPEHPNLGDPRPVSAVRDSPKPPPTRLTLSLDVLNSADEVWVIASGPEKAKAVASALGGADVRHTPAAGVHGTRRTLWLVDAGAAAELPARPNSR